MERNGLINIEKIKQLYCLLLLTAVFIYGCATEYNLATEKPEFIVVSREQEDNFGQSLARRLESSYRLVADPHLQEKIELIGQKIVEVSDRKDIIYHFKILEADEVNAISLPGGYIYVFKGLLEKIPEESEIAGVLAHEVAHVVAKHPIKRLQGLLGYNLMRILMAGQTRDPRFIQGVDLAFTQLFLAYSRDDELLADRLGVKYIKEAGYNPEGMLKVLNKLREIDREKPIRAMSTFRTHPYIADRIRVVKEEIYGKIDFVDYINKTQP